MMQMEQWSILSNVLKYVQHSKLHSIGCTLDVRAVNKCRHKPNIEGEREFIEMDFGAPLKLCEEYIDVHEGIQSEIVNATRFDENSDLSTIYLRRIDKESKNRLRAEESFPILEHGYTSGRLLDGTECQLLLDTGASKSFMSKSLFIIPVITDVHRQI